MGGVWCCALWALGADGVASVAGARGGSSSLSDWVAVTGGARRLVRRGGVQAHSYVPVPVAAVEGIGLAGAGVGAVAVAVVANGGAGIDEVGVSEDAPAVVGVEVEGEGGVGDADDVCSKRSGVAGRLKTKCVHGAGEDDDWGGGGGESGSGGGSESRGGSVSDSVGEVCGDNKAGGSVTYVKVVWHVVEESGAQRYIATSRVCRKKWLEGGMMTSETGRLACTKSREWKGKGKTSVVGMDALVSVAIEAGLVSPVQSASLLLLVSAPFCAFRRCCCRGCCRPGLEVVPVVVVIAVAVAIVAVVVDVCAGEVVTVVAGNLRLLCLRDRVRIAVDCACSFGSFFRLVAIRFDFGSFGDFWRC